MMTAMLLLRNFNGAGAVPIITGPKTNVVIYE